MEIEIYGPDENARFHAHDAKCAARGIHAKYLQRSFAGESESRYAAVKAVYDFLEPEDILSTLETDFDFHFCSKALPKIPTCVACGTKEADTASDNEERCAACEKISLAEQADAEPAEVR